MNGRLYNSNNKSPFSDSEASLYAIRLGKADTRVTTPVSRQLSIWAIRGRSGSVVCRSTVITPVSRRRESASTRLAVLINGSNVTLSRGEVWTAL